MKKGFTLIELLVVIGIIIMLMLVIYPQFQNSQDRARITAIGSDLKNIASALEQFYADWGKYPGAGGTPSYTVLKNELTGSGGTINTSTNKTVLGESGPKVYMTSSAFTSLENTVGGATITYTLNGTTYTISVTIPTASGNKTISVTNGGVISVS
ncbi:MAG: prepilin-type N-terminal cleavage/methylation domain-containing protein [Conexivisphaerales archaeon]